ncbi:MAG: leucine--tRNA ligase [Leptospiraceae bacterium]|nr:leucine--tRNA ligase [Leptospiraceae bacterium]MDW7976016.1 leucine--tRNA ligase [Leptospiraceae bacterium]
MTYPFKTIEKKWQEYWETKKTFKTTEDPTKPKFYVLDMFPYPSAQGLHVGHPEGYTATDIIARYKRHRGYNVLHPMGWDAFGLPAERYAMQTGIHPAITTKKNIENFKRQLKSLGFSYDWDREIDTTDPKYYKWTQWIFLKIFNSYYDPILKKARPIEELPIPEELNQPGKEKEREDYINRHRLAYIQEAPVNYSPELGTVLANEEVEEWTSKGYTVVRKSMKQWMLRITAYAERLLEDLKLVDWPESTVELQKNWIGRSEGAIIYFDFDRTSKKALKEKGLPTYLEVFTTRPDTLFGVTYMVVAPEHPVVPVITRKKYKKQVEAYIENTLRKTDLERTSKGIEAEKTGVFTGAYVHHPFTNEKIPIWISDYVLMSYGTGAIMAVPAHDQRDFLFAKTFGLPIKTVVSPDGNPDFEVQDEAFVEEGININSDFLNGLPTKEAKKVMIQELEKPKKNKQIKGKFHVSYKLRDWLFSRQRYWGEPIPISFDENGFYVPEDEKNLPLELPPSEDFKPVETGESPLAKIKDWVEYEHPVLKKKLRRETNTMPQWAGSCWYYLRYIDPHNDKEMVNPEKEKYWMQPNGVDLYIGGAEHAVLHLLYARFWHKVLYDLGYVSTPEPFYKLVHQGIILGEDGQKMSKSRGNVINPDDVIDAYGADTFRMYEMFMGPLEVVKPWSSKAIEGVFRFLSRVFRFYTLEESGNYRINPEILEEPDKAYVSERDYWINLTIKNVTENIEKIRFNKAISDMMIFMNEAYKIKKIGRKAAEDFVILLSPFAPHLAEELWELLGHKETIAYVPWPNYDEEKIKRQEVEIVFQVNGKIRAKKMLPLDLEENELEKEALSEQNVQKHISGKSIIKIITVKNKLVNIVVK